MSLCWWGGHGNPPQYSRLENPIDRGAWRAQSMGLQRVGQGWSGLAHKHASLLIAAAAAESLQSCPTLQPHRRQPARLLRPWDFPGKSTGVGCHCLLRLLIEEQANRSLCSPTRKVKVKSCPTLCNPVDCSLPGPSVHGIFQAIVLEWIAISFSRGSSRAWTQVSRIVDRRFTTWATREVHVYYRNL